MTNIEISESDPVQVPWRDELVTNLPVIDRGIVSIPQGPGWGTDLNEKALKQYATKN